MIDTINVFKLIQKSITEMETNHISKDIPDVPPALEPRYPMDCPHMKI